MRPTDVRTLGFKPRMSCNIIKLLKKKVRSADHSRSGRLTTAATPQDARRVNGSLNAQQEWKNGLDQLSASQKGNHTHFLNDMATRKMPRW